MTRPRGFISSWNPKPDTQSLLKDVSEILHDYEDIKPLTLRQIFYMLVSEYGFKKTEKDYKRLCETMNRARRAGYIEMDDIRDDKLRKEVPHEWSSEASFIATIKQEAENFRLNRQEEQETHIMVWCEAGGMVPQLVSYCEDYGVTVLSSGGFDSVTTKHNFARDISEQHDAVEILHIGDHDPSGVHMCSSLDEDLTAFVEHYGGDVTVTRLAVVPRQIEALGLPSSPPKKTDNRSFEGLTTQAEAIPPRTLKDIVTSAIEYRLDMEVYRDVLERETMLRETLTDRLKDL